MLGSEQLLCYYSSMFINWCRVGVLGNSLRKCTQQYERAYYSPVPKFSNTYVQTLRSDTSIGTVSIRLGLVLNDHGSSWWWVG